MSNATERMTEEIELIIRDANAHDVYVHEGINRTYLEFLRDAVSYYMIESDGNDNE